MNENKPRHALTIGIADDYYYPPYTFAVASVNVTVTEQGGKHRWHSLADCPDPATCTVVPFDIHQDTVIPQHGATLFGRRYS